MTKDDIKRTLDIIYGQIFNQGRADLLPGLITGPYIQHNPLFPDGPDGIRNYIKQVGRVRCEVKRIAIDGDLAFVHVFAAGVSWRLLHGVGGPDPLGDRLRHSRYSSESTCRRHVAGGEA